MSAGSDGEMGSVGPDEVGSDTDDVIRAKWAVDGASTLPEAADRLHGYAEELERAHRQGYRLRGPVEDDHGFVYHTDPQRHGRMGEDPDVVASR